MRRAAAAAFLILAAVVLVSLTHAYRGGAAAGPRTLAQADSVPTRSPAPVRSSAADLNAGAPWTPAQESRLRADTADAFASSLAGADRWSLVVLSSDGRVLYDNHAERAVTPASTQKLLVAATSLAILGPDFRYHTLLTARTVDGDGIAGDLYLVGSGDPSLASDDLRGGVKILAKRGVRRVAGRVVVDAHAISGPEINPLWNAADANEDFQSATSAVSLDQDNVEFDVIGAQPGAPAQVHVEPPSSVVHATGTVASTGTGTPSNVIVAAMESPNTFVVSGHIPAGAEEKYWVPVHGIAHYTGSVLENILDAHRILVRQDAAIGIAPLDSGVLWDHRSPPLHELIQRMLYESNNHFAEQILRTIGDVGPQVVGDTSGIRTERRFLAAHAIPTPGLHVVDGSGLAHANRIAAITLARILIAAEHGESSGFSRLYYLLPQGGRQGTLKHYDFTTALGRVRAKTGHLDNVSALAGYVNTYHHGRLVFAFLVNGSPGDPDDAMVRALDRLAVM